MSKAKTLLLIATAVEEYEQILKDLPLDPAEIRSRKEKADEAFDQADTAVRRSSGSDRRELVSAFQAANLRMEQIGARFYAPSTEMDDEEDEIDDFEDDALGFDEDEPQDELDPRERSHIYSSLSPEDEDDDEDLPEADPEMTSS